jgi:putative beta-barrel porin BBP2
MTPLDSIKIVCAIGVLLALEQRLCAQEVITAAGPVVQTRPDDGTPMAGTLVTNPIANALRRAQLTLSIVGGYDDNVNASAGAAGGGSSSSLYTSTNAGLSYTGGTSRTQLNLSAGVGVTDYFDVAGRSNDINAYFGLSLTHKVNTRLTLSFATFASYQSQPDLSTNLGSNRQLGSFFHGSDVFSVAYYWTHRFSTVTSYNVGELRYDTFPGSLQDRLEQTFGQELRLLLFPTITAVGEYRFSTINYDKMGSLDSTTHFLLAGLDHSFSPRLNATFRGGVELRSSQSNSDQPGPFFESTVNYAFARAGALTWTNRYSIEEPDVPGAMSGAAFRTGLTLKYRLTRRLSGNLAAFYIHGDNGSGGSSSSTEDTFDIGPSLNCMISHRLSANVGFHHTEVDSSSVLGSYSRNSFFSGLTVVF